MPRSSSTIFSPASEDLTMLEPQERQLFLEILRPPEGYELDLALGTTYSLDLVALMSVPLSFSRLDWESDNTGVTRDPIALLASMRKHSDRITVFCQAGGIYLPHVSLPLLHYVEETVVQVTSRHGGVFHPKVWILRYADSTKKVLYRVACLSRNLTFDRSWDTALVLEGELIDRHNAYAVNHPLADFVKNLIDIAPRPLDGARRANIRKMSEELRKVDFVLPRGFKEMQFRGIGFGEREEFLVDAAERLLIVSPFVDDRFLGMAKDLGAHTTLISRLESLQALSSKSLRTVRKVFFLNDAVSDGTADTVEDGAPGNPGSSPSPMEGEERNDDPHGLHAKLFIAEQGGTATVVTGSANATGAALEQNVEFSIALSGPKGQVGIDSFLKKGERGTTSFADMLEPYVPDEEHKPADAGIRKLERELDHAIHSFAARGLKAKIAPLENTSDWTIVIEANRAAADRSHGPVTRIECWPVTIAEGRAVELRMDETTPAQFERLSTQALTPFFAFRFTGASEGSTLRKTRVFKVPLEGGPQDRREMALQLLLQDKTQLMKLLMFLLGDGESSPLIEIGGTPKDGNSGNSWSMYGENTLFEMMVKALHRDKRRIDEVEKVVRDLARVGDGSSLFPEGFEQIWQPIREARERMGI
jgi:hypothetical protein